MDYVVIVPPVNNLETLSKKGSASGGTNAGSIRTVHEVVKTIRLRFKTVFSDNRFYI